MGQISSLHFFHQDNIRDITDSLIDHCEDRKLDENSNIQVSDEKIVGIVNDLFGAGELLLCFLARQTMGVKQQRNTEWECVS